MVPRFITILWMLPLLASAAAEPKIDFNRDIRPLISSNCVACHGPDEAERKAGLRLDTQEGSRADLGGYAAVVPGDLEASELIYRITTDDPNDAMPPEGKGRRFTAAEVATIRRWIEQGADYAKHWAYEKPVRPAVPDIRNPKLEIRNPIDHFVRVRLKAEGLEPSPEADRFTLARRVAMDLTGLPPTWDEAQKFASDTRPDAYARYVDSQLAKPAFGERWARVWLDLARYADSAGYADDPPRTIWAYRDWVVRAFNENLPFDQFTIEQIAGDLLESPTRDQLVATAFHRNTLTNNEGGTNNEEFRNVAVIDRVNTTMEVWMGTTMACAQCHTHKYDPITQEEYFRFFDFFNQSEDSDQRDERPLLELWTDEQIEQKKGWEARVGELKAILATDTPELAAARETWLKRVQREPAWTALRLKQARGATLAEKPGNSGFIQLSGEKPDTATYGLDFATQAGKISGLRLEVAPGQNGNFVLNQVSAVWSPKDVKGLDGRFVRVELPGDRKMIHLAEVQVFSGGQNVALASSGGKASQSSTDFGGPAHLAIDGNTDGNYDKKSVTHTAIQANPWFEIDLGAVKSIDRVVLWNRTGTGLEDRLAGFKIQVLDDKRGVVWEQSPEVPKPSAEFAMSGARNLDFRAAFADYEQGGFNAQAAIAAKADAKKGWSIGGATGKPHELTLILRNAVEIGAGVLTVNLSQISANPAHVLTDFRISTTDDPNVTEWARMPADVREIVRGKKADPKRLAAFHRTIAGQLAPQRAELAKLEESLKNAKPSTTVPIMRDLPADKARLTKVQLRGNYKNTAQTVEMATPAVFHPLREDVPRNRLALAHWLVDAENPLTPRVMVNRFWAQIFGGGIVETAEEFGSQGELPTHPELLDWLAVEFRENWDVKGLLKLLVSSATYRQSSKTTPQLLEADPFNRLYARGPRFRISAEMVRDQALFVSGLLSDKMGGPPVKPPQPELGLKAAFGSATDWKTSMGEDKFRRGLYTTWRRSSPYPSMAAFDAPNREVCTSRRGRTNTPLQALVTLNDPVYVEAAQALARRLAEGGDSTESRAKFGLRACLLREPGDAEVSRIVQLFETAKSRFSQLPEQAKLMAEEPIGPIPEGADPIEMAAWTVVGNVLLNLDEMFLKR